MKYEPIYRIAKTQFQENLLKELVGQVLLYHFIRNEPFYIEKSEYPELVNRDFLVTDEMFLDVELSKIVSLNDNYAPAEDLRSRAIFLVQNYLEEEALDTESELQKIYQRIPFSQLGRRGGVTLTFQDVTLPLHFPERPILRTSDNILKRIIMSKTITMLDAPCGAGKSYTLHQKINELVVGNGEEVLVSVPSIKLADQYERDLSEKYPNLPIEVIHSENIASDEKAVIVISKRLREKTSPRATIITQTAFNIMENRPFYHHGTEIKIVDEIPIPFKMMKYDVEAGIKRLLPLIEVVSNDKHEEYYSLHCKSTVALNKVAAERDEYGNITPLQELAYQLLSTNYLNVVNKKHWDERRAHEIHLYCLMNNNIYKNFKDVIIAGACFTDSALYKLWNKMGVSFDADNNLSNNMRYTEHPNGSQLKVYYSIKGHNWSKRLMQDKNEDGNFVNEGHNFRLIENAVLHLFEGEFLYNANDRYKVFEGIDRAIQLPQLMHGINDYMDHVDVACLSARNLDVSYIHFLKSFVDLDLEDVRNCIGRQFTYQSALRGALRNPYDHRPKRVYIPDEGTGRWFADMFDGCELIHLPIEGLKLPERAGRPRMHKSEAERKAKRRRKTKASMIVATETCADDGHDFRGTFFAHKADNEGLGTAITETYQEFEQQWKSWAENNKRPKAEKGKISEDDNRLISPAYFEAKDGVDTKRGRGNVIFANGIMLDCDEIPAVIDKDTQDVIRPVRPPIHSEQFAKLFPMLRMTICNSYSSKCDWLKYHIYIPTDRVMSSDEYLSVVGSIRDIASNAGIDKSKVYPESMFYLPSQAKDVFGNYYELFDEGVRDVLYVDDWLLPKSLSENIMRDCIVFAT